MRRLLLAAVFCSVSLAGVGCESHSRVDSIYRMNEGIKQLKKGNTSGAEAALKDAIKIDPTHGAAHEALGKLYRKQGKWADAGAAYEEAIKYMADNPNANYYYQLALVQKRLGEEKGVSRAEKVAKYQAAIANFESAIKLDPQHYRAHHQAGELHEALDQPEKADQAYRKAIELNGRHSPSFVALGNMYIDYGFSNVAMAVLQVGTQINDVDPAMWSGLGRAELQLNRPQQAVDAFKKAKAIDPDLPDVLFGLGRAYTELRQKTEAEENLELFLKKANAETPEHYQKAARDMLARMQDVI